jgi:two-component system, OmpR family, sensor kinase
VRLWPTSVRARLTLWYTVLLGLPLIAFATVCYIAFARALDNRTDRFMGDALSAFTRELGAERRASSDAAVAMRATVNEVRFRELHIMILDSAGRVMARAEPPEDEPVEERQWWAEDTTAVVALRGHDTAKPATLTISTERGAYRLVAHPLSFEGRRLVLLGTYSLKENEETMARIRRMFVIAIPLLLACAATGGHFLAKRGLAPVSSMATHAAEITASNLHERLPVTGGDEMVRLARVVNDLLDRLELSFEQQRRFMADASHELRTPTATVRTEADVTLSREHRDEEEYRASVTIIQNASRRLTRIVDDLFLLARADSGQPIAHRGPLYLEEVVHDATRAVRQIADRRSVQIALGDVVEAPFHGDADLLGRLLLNLLDNAIRYSPPNGTVDVSMTRRDGQFEILVGDAGPGIPAEAQERVFERFFQVDPSRTRGTNGSATGAGLGLAIARRIADMHGGRLELAESRPGRTVFRLRLPVDAPQRPKSTALL